MSRNLYILAAVLVVLALLSFGLSLTTVSHQPDLPGETSMWRMMALVLFFLGIVSCLAGTLTNLFEQASRRSEARDRKNGPRP